MPANPRPARDPKRASRAPRPSRPQNPDAYTFLSTRPLHVAVFLTPLIALYELGSALYLSSAAGGHQTIKARRLLDDFFETFGVAGLYVPAAALLTVLLVWHVMIGDKWRVRITVLLGMLAESVAWTLPLLVLAALMGRASHTLSALAGQPGAGLAGLPWQARVTVAIGAGLYEEMLFRLIGVAVLHFVLADVARIKESWASAIAVIGAAVAFAFYHRDVNTVNLVFLSSAGLYFGMLYLLRGFGVVVATHALYDVLVLVLLTQNGAHVGA